MIHAAYHLLSVVAGLLVGSVRRVWDLVTFFVKEPNRMGKGISITRPMTILNPRRNLARDFDYKVVDGDVDQ
jgi:hypothetical protein